MNARQIFLWYFLAIIIVLIVFYEQLNTAFDSWRMEGCEHVKDIDAYALTVNPVNGDLWGISYDNLFQFDGRDWRTHQVPSLQAGYASEAFIVFDPRGAMWQGGWKGVGVFDGQDWIFYKEQDWGLPHTVVTSIAFDPTGKPWVGLSATGASPQRTCGGVSILDGQRWITYRFENRPMVGPGCQSVQSIQFDTSGNAWLGLSNSAIMVLEKTRDKTFQAAVPGEPMFSSTVRTTGYFLIPEESFPKEGDKGPVVIKDFSSSPLVLNMTIDGYSVSTIRSILFDKQGNKWINADDGLYQLRDDSVVPAWSPATRTVIDAQGNLWSIGQGVGMYNGRIWQTYRAGNSCIGNEDVRAIAFDKNNRGWVARISPFEQEFSLSTFDQLPHRVPDVLLRLRAIFLPPPNPWLRWVGPVILSGVWSLIFLGAKWPALTFPLLNMVLALLSERIHQGQYNPTLLFEAITLFSLGGGWVDVIARREKEKRGFWENAAPGFYGTLVGGLFLFTTFLLWKRFGPSS
jgi:hypothetical protein